MANSKEALSTWRTQLGNIVFDSDTKEGRLFDLILLWAIVGSVFVVMLDSVQHLAATYGTALFIAEWVFTILFTIEYLIRVLIARKPRHYIFSFFGIVDLLSILPGYVSLVYAESRYLLVLRAIRLLRIFRVLKLVRYLRDADTLLTALDASRRKIFIFVYTVLTIVCIVGTLMYLIEGPESGFTSIPISVYWAIVTLTTVGYGDIAPQSALGQTLASCVMVMGYGIIAVPTGIVTVELSRVPASKPEKIGAELVSDNRVCSRCGTNSHLPAARYCHHCGEGLGQISVTVG